MEDDALKQPPFRAEYSKSSRAKCKGKGCGNLIMKDDLRLAKMTKSPFFDGMQPNWYHYDCFFAQARPNNVGEISHFESIRYEDQERIKKQIEKFHPTSAKEGSKNKGEFKFEYAKSSQAKCLGCENPIKKQELRVGKIDHNSDVSTKFGVDVFRWYHPNCFAEVREVLEFFTDGSQVAGFRDLEVEDQKLIKKLLPVSKKRKMKDAPAAKPSKMSKEDIQLEKDIKKQSEEIYKVRDALSKNMDNGTLKLKLVKSFLEFNKQEVPHGDNNKLLDRLSDIMNYGALKPCTVCKNGQYVFRSGVGYNCTGHISEFAKCANVTDDPERVAFRLPKDLDDSILEACPFLVPFKKGKVGKRIIPKHVPAVAESTATSSTVDPFAVRSSAYAGPKVNFKPLKDFRFILHKSIATAELKDKITEYGGKPLIKLVADHIAAVISTKKYVEAKKDDFTNFARSNGIPIISDEFMNDITESNFQLEPTFQKYLLADWIKPNDVKAHLSRVNEKYGQNPEEKNRNKLELEMKKVRLKMKNGAVVDPESGLEESGHVYKEGSVFYTSVLNKVDVEEGKNSYYKLQLIESDKGRNYWVFRSWGRLGTIIGGQQTVPQDSLEDAKEFYHKLYAEKSKNQFGMPFKQKPGSYVPMDIDFGEKKHLEKLVPDMEKSKLELAVQQLLCKIYDVENMQKTLMEFELDLEKMPLGKISRTQVMKAYSALNDAMKLAEEDKKEKDSRKLVEVTNRFFTLIPHSFGVSHNLPMLREPSFIKTKLDMLENLLEIELAYELLQQGGDGIDSNYKNLKCGIRSLEHSSNVWKILETYLLNTHAPTHTEFGLEVANIFAVERKGELVRYNKFKDLHNRKLLWHGSRSSNYVGILSQGLRIAPPEAPVTGYMFGKGVYFADMVSKSANYCYPSRNDSATGLLLLCEVALGDMHELTDANDRLLAPPTGKHSVKGLGKTIPDPKEEYTLPTGAVVPYGKPTPSTIKNSQLLYNEYIVYDTAQVNILYLMEVKFKFNKRGR